MDDSGSITHFVHELRSDDPRRRDAAARVVWERYFRELLALARRQLGWRVRARVDEEDVLQSVYASVCRRQGRGEFDLHDRDDLWRLLVTITLRKARNAARWHTRDKRDVRREAAPADDPETGPIAEGLAGLGPAPDEALALADAFERRMAALPDELLRRVALRRLEGFGNREIAVELGCTERSVERKLHLIREIWAPTHGDVDDPGD